MMEKKKLEKIAKSIASNSATVVYSAVVIDKSDRDKILKNAVHPNEYGEHTTLKYYGKDGPTETPYAGSRVNLTLKKHYADDKGDAWTIDCSDPVVAELKDPNQTLHVTVSCADGTKPFYSNTLIRTAKPDDKEGFVVKGKIGYFMSNGRWFFG